MDTEFSDLKSRTNELGEVAKTPPPRGLSSSRPLVFLVIARFFGDQKKRCAPAILVPSRVILQIESTAALLLQNP